MSESLLFNSVSTHIPADEYREWNDSAKDFNNTIRNFVIELIFFGVHLVIGHYLLRKWRRPLEAELPDLKHLHDIHDVILKKENRDDQFVYLIAQISCTFAVSIGLCCISLLPVSVLCNEVKVFCNDFCPYWWFDWLSAELLLEGWSRVSFLTSMFLFLIMPFTFFLIEADGFSWGPRKGLRARFYETVLTISLLGILVVFFFFVLLGLLSAQGFADSWKTLGFFNIVEVTPVLRTFISFAAIVLMLIALPLGQQDLLNETTNAILLLRPQTSIRAQLKRVTIEREYIRRRLKLRPRLRRRSTTANELIDRETTLQKDAERLDEMLNLSILGRFVFRPLCLLLILAAICFAISSCFYRTAQILFPNLAGDPNTLRFSSLHFGVTSLGKNSIIRTLDHAVSLMKVVTAIWITHSGLTGFYWKIMPTSWKPTKLSTPLHKLILQCTLFLLLCSAVPLLNALLTGVPLPIKFSGSPALIGSRYQMLFCTYYSLFSIYSIGRALPLTKREALVSNMLSAWNNSQSPRKAP